MNSKHLSITGIVQGVGYRYSFEQQAHALGLSGWVRNRRDGSVEAYISGEAQALEKIIEWARSGPAGASVDQVVVTDAPCDSLSKGRFHRLPTV